MEVWPEYWDGFSEIPGAIPCITTDFLCDLGQVIECFGETEVMMLPSLAQTAVKINVLQSIMRGPYKYNIKQSIWRVHAPYITW